MNKLLLFASILLVLTSSCKKEPEIDDSLLDGDVLFDPSLYNPEAYLVSAKYPQPTTSDLNKHVILAIHGYSASTFEWDEFREWSTDTNYRISQVLLGGHGRDYESFKVSSWQDWKSSIVDEYDKLIELGYTNISLVGSSTGGTLLLELTSSKYFENTLHPKNMFLIDPIVVASNKLQSIAGIVGPMIVYATSNKTEEQQQYWYEYQPQETINELNEVMGIVRKDLEDGFKLPTGTYFKVFHSKHDPTSSTTSTVLIHKGLEMADGSAVDVQIMDSEIHVFTRLSLRSTVSTLERTNQFDAFSQIANRLK